jgi:hypothetical protein
VSSRRSGLATVQNAELGWEIGHNANRVPVLVGPRIAVGK